ncbi:MAG: hypothetical protein MUC47_07465, partial [Candidatus Kapabacteria bacterium]|nr:hypothetical protein [Candidatus Kapabacteria bacterium]
PTFTALAAHVADVADRLSSGASGVVTSINEQSGPIWFRGENGITVRKDSTTFTIAGVGGGQHLSGVIMGSGSADYDIELPALPLHPHDVVVSIESPNTTILAHVVAILPMLPGIRIRASAYVLPEERIHWYMIRR